MKITYKHKNQITYCGAGTILIELYKNNDGVTKPVVLLFAGAYDKQYQDLGGGIELTDTKHTDTLAYTAIRETMEESRNTFVFTNTKHVSQLKYIDIKSKNNCFYRSYIVCVPLGVFHTKYFINNKKILDKSNVSNVWREMIGVKRFYLEDLLICIKNDQKYCNSVDGLSCHIRQRTIDLINYILHNSKKDLKYSIEHPVSFKKVITKRIQNMVSLTV